MNALGDETHFQGARLEGAVLDGLDTGKCDMRDAPPLVAPANFPNQAAAALDGHE